MSIDIQTEPVAEARSETDVTDTAKQIIIDLRSKQPDDDGIANYIAGRLDGGETENREALEKALELLAIEAAPQTQELEAAPSRLAIEAAPTTDQTSAGPLENNPIERARLQIRQIENQIKSIDERLLSTEVPDNQKQELEKKRNELSQHLDFFNRRISASQGDSVVGSEAPDKLSNNIPDRAQIIENLEEQMRNHPVDSPERNELALERQRQLRQLENESQESMERDDDDSSNLDISDESADLSEASSSDVDVVVEQDSDGRGEPENEDMPNDINSVDQDTEEESHDEAEPEKEPKYGYARANRDDDLLSYEQLYADQKMEADLEEGGFFKKRMKRFFKGRLLRRFYETRYKQEYDRLKEENGGYLEVPLEILRGYEPETAKDMAQRASMATTEWLLSQDPQVTGTRRSGEERTEISGNPQVDGQLRSVLKDLALRYARGDLDDDSIIEERDRLLEQIDGLNDDLFGKGVGFSDSIIELARSVKADIEHGVALDSVESALNAIELRGGYSRSSAEAKVRRTILDKISKKIGTSRIGGTAIATGLITATSLVFCATDRGATSSAATALRMTGIGSAAAGVIAGATEYGVVKREAALVRQESVYGYEKDDSDNPHRRKMEEAVVYMAESVPENIEDLQCFLDENGELREDISDQEIILVARTTSRLKTLLRESDTRRIDLLKFSSVSSAAVERLELIMSLAAVETALDNRVARGGEVTIIGPNNTPQQIDLATAVNQTLATAERSSEADVEENEVTHNRAYKKMMAKRVAIAAAAGTVVGFGTGVLISEGAAILNPNVTGLFEQQQPGAPNTLLTTLIQGRHNGFATYKGSPDLVDALKGSKGTSLIEHKGTGLHMKVPDGLEVKFDKGSRSFDLISSKNGAHIMDNVEFGKNGRINPASADQLRQLGLDFDQHPVRVQGSPKIVDSHRFINWHERRGDIETTRIIDNAVNSRPGLIGDHNELDLHASGDNGNWQQSNGSIKIGISGITEDGSWNGSRSYNVPQALEQGRGKIMVTVNDHFKKSGQYKTFLFDVSKDKDGDGWHAVIPKNHPVASWFGKGGSIDDFHGPSLEQLQNPQSSVLDSRNSLAFVIDDDHSPHTGDFVSIASIPGSGEAPYEIPSPDIEYRSVITGIAIDGPGETLPAFGPPIYQRRGVGAPNKRPEGPPPPVTPYDRYMGGEGRYGRRQQEAEEILREVSPRIKDDARLDLATEGDWYRDHIDELQGEDYKREVIDLYESSPELQNLPAETKALVLLPVGATGESENIYDTLSMWAKQARVKKGDFSIVLAVNHLEGQQNDPELAKKIQKTKDEIARAQNDFPDLKIISVEFEISQDLVNQRNSQQEGPGIIGDITRRLYDLSLLAATDHVKKGTSEKDDILLIRSDADIKGLSPVYVDRMLKGAEVMQSADAFRGEKVFGVNDPSLRKNLPGLMIAGAFAAFRYRGDGSRNPSRSLWLDGTNFSVRASTLAAIGGMGSSQYSGAGSDDLWIGTRINVARGKPADSGVGYGGYQNEPGKEDTDPQDSPIRFVGAAIDSDPSRLIGVYLAGGNPLDGSAWRTFSDGPSGYTSRDKDVPEKLKPESNAETCSRVESLITQSIQGMSLAEATLVVQRFFGRSDVCKVSGGSAGKDLTVTFTSVGKKYIKQVVARNQKAMVRNRGFLVSRSRHLMRGGHSPMKRWLTK